MLAKRGGFKRGLQTKRFNTFRFETPAMTEEFSAKKNRGNIMSSFFQKSQKEIEGKQ